MVEGSSMSKFNNEESKPEKVQKLLYTILEKLQAMTQQLPIKYQSRISLELLSDLANCLIHNTIFAIIGSLMEIQHETEKQLFEKRENIKLQFESEKNEIFADETHTESERLVIIAEKQNEYEKELYNFHEYIIEQLDLRVREQQNVLKEAGVPGFYETNNQNEIRIQMYLLDFILRISKMMKNHK